MNGFLKNFMFQGKFNFQVLKNFNKVMLISFLKLDLYGTKATMNNNYMKELLNRIFKEF